MSEERPRALRLVPFAAGWIVGLVVTEIIPKDKSRPWWIGGLVLLSGPALWLWHWIELRDHEKRKKQSDYEKTKAYAEDEITCEGCGRPTKRMHCFPVTLHSIPYGPARQSPRCRACIWKHTGVHPEENGVKPMAELPPDESQN